MGSLKKQKWLWQGMDVVISIQYCTAILLPVSLALYPGHVKSVHVCADAHLCTAYRTEARPSGRLLVVGS